eukprot:TRINITY_DN1677_c0_g1_i3.p1 TRINITY_DN1677_c0_g1~~TRINITY_DN1677_c0_g1_i3.p1  ORF type:complete len:536 (+),score=114.74 TRINITY_DN1677_c0_g1_i3:379-1986(+)
MAYVCKVQALYDYDAEDTNEMTIKEGDIILVLNKGASGWWKGEVGGKIGHFPSNFVEVIEEPIVQNEASPPVQPVKQSVPAAASQANQQPAPTSGDPLSRTLSPPPNGNPPAKARPAVKVAVLPPINKTALKPVKRDEVAPKEPKPEPTSASSTPATSATPVKNANPPAKAFAELKPPAKTPSPQTQQPASKSADTAALPNRTSKTEDSAEASKRNRPMSLQVAPGGNVIPRKSAEKAERKVMIAVPEGYSSNIKLSTLWEDIAPKLAQIMDSCNKSGDKTSASLTMCSVLGRYFEHGNAKVEAAFHECAFPFIKLMSNDSSPSNLKEQSHPYFAAGSKDANYLTAPEAILASSQIYPNLGMDDATRLSRVLAVLNDFSSISKSRIACSMPYYLSLRDSSHKEKSAAYWMKSASKLHSEDVEKAFQFYLQMCSISSTSKAAATLAAVLANEGVDLPEMSTKHLDTEKVAQSLESMKSCGLPGSASVSLQNGLLGVISTTGIALVVIPKVAGIAAYFADPASALEFIKQVNQTFTI